MSFEERQAQWRADQERRATTWQPIDDFRLAAESFAMTVDRMVERGMVLRWVERDD
jgi:hypothetical protein